MEREVEALAAEITNIAKPSPWAATYTIRVSMPQSYRELFETPGAIRVRLTTQELGRVSSFLQDLQFIHVWIGTLTSNAVAFPSDCVQLR